MSRRKQHVPWTAAGTASEQQHSADDVVRRTGWVFNNRTGQELDLAAFVERMKKRPAYQRAVARGGELRL